MASTPEKIRAALLRVEQKFDKLRRHAKRLEWDLKNAEALTNLAGWVAVYTVLHTNHNSQNKFVFPIAEFFGRTINATVGIWFDKTDNSVVLQEAIAPKSSVRIKLGEHRTTTWEWHMIYCGFFATRKEAKDFVKQIEAEPEKEK